MLVSAIVLYSMYTGLSGHVNSKGNDTETAVDTLPPQSEDTNCAECKLYSNINMWKHFCYKQMDAGNLDIIA